MGFSGRRVDMPMEGALESLGPPFDKGAAVRAAAEVLDAGAKEIGT